MATCATFILHAEVTQIWFPFVFFFSPSDWDLIFTDIEKPNLDPIWPLSDWKFMFCFFTISHCSAFVHITCHFHSVSVPQTSKNKTWRRAATCLGVSREMIYFYLKFMEKLLIALNWKESIAIEQFLGNCTICHTADIYCCMQVTHLVVNFLHVWLFRSRIHVTHKY